MNQNGYQPTKNNLNRQEPPQNGSGVPTQKTAVTCPVCHGTGHVDGGFYNRTSESWASAGGVEQCRSCKGTGFVVVWCNSDEQNMRDKIP